jgi:hypothetical protein
VMSATDLEIEDAIWEAWTILYAEPAASPVARRLATALLAMTRGTQAHPHWITPDDLWRDRLTVLAEQNAWLVHAAGEDNLIVRRQADGRSSSIGMALPLCD